MIYVLYKYNISHYKTLKIKTRKLQFITCVSIVILYIKFWQNVMKYYKKNWIINLFIIIIISELGIYFSQVNF